MTPARVLTHVDNDLAVEGAQDLDPDHLAELTRMEVAGELTATQAKQVLADMVETGRDPRRDRRRAGGSRPWTPTPSKPSSTPSIADNPDEWAEYVNGDDKRRGKLTGFFVGKVMQASKGQADGKTVTAIPASTRRWLKVGRYRHSGVSTEPPFLADAPSRPRRPRSTLGQPFLMRGASMRKLGVLLVAGVLLFSAASCTTKTAEDVSAGSPSTEASNNDNGETSTTRRSTTTTESESDSGDTDVSDIPHSVISATASRCR